MGFKPRMQSIIDNILPIQDVCSLQFDHMVVDYWQVQNGPRAKGEYVSPDPRFVMLFDKARIALQQKDTPITPDFSACNACDAREDCMFRNICNVCYVPSGMPLVGLIKDAGRFEHMDIHIDQAQLHRIIGNQSGLEQALFLSASSELRRLSALLADECQKQQRPLCYSEALVYGIIYEIFHLGMSQTKTAEKPLWLAQVTSFVHENIAQPIKVDVLARLVNMSRSEFSRQFKDLIGMSPYQWILRLRIEQAQLLLSDGKSIAQTAYDTGFADQAHFSRCFRQVLGVTPGQWIGRYVSSKH